MYGTDVDWFEEHPNLFASEMNEMVAHSESPNLVLSVVKFNQREFPAARHNTTIDVKEFFENNNVSKTSQWEMLAGESHYFLS
jgi:hypothetical protein